MKNIVGHARNEPFELILGNVLIGIGGFLLGIALSFDSLLLMMIPAFPIFGIGIIFDVRVLTKFSHELSSIRKEIDQARKELEDSKNRIEEVKKESEEYTRRTALTLG